MHGPSQELIVSDKTDINNINLHAFEPKQCESNCLFKDGFGFEVPHNNWKNIGRYESDALVFIVRQLKSFEIT